MPKIMIELSKKEYEGIKALDYANVGRMSGKALVYAALQSIKCGTPLPKGHGRLIDADNLMEYCLNQKVKTVDCNDIARFPTIIKRSENENKNI